MLPVFGRPGARCLETSAILLQKHESTKCGWFARAVGLANASVCAGIGQRDSKNNDQSCNLERHFMPQKQREILPSTATTASLQPTSDSHTVLLYYSMICICTYTYELRKYYGDCGCHKRSGEVQGLSRHFHMNIAFVFMRRLLIRRRRCNCRVTKFMDAQHRHTVWQWDTQLRN